MEQFLTPIKELADHAKEYVRIRMDEVKLTAAEKTSLVVSNLVAGAVVMVVFLFFLLFASVAGALAIGKWVGYNWVGFLILAGVYLFVGIIVWAGRERLIRLPVMNNIIHLLFKDDNIHEPH